MAAGNYKLNYYKGCPSMTILHVGLDLLSTMFNVFVFLGTMEFFSEGNIGKGFLGVLVLISLGVAYFKLAFAIDKRGRAKEAKKKEQRNALRQSASKEEILKIMKQEKQEDFFMVVGIIAAVIVIVPIGACVCIWCMMHFM